MYIDRHQKEKRGKLQQNTRIPLLNKNLIQNLTLKSCKRGEVNYGKTQDRELS